MKKAMMLAATLAMVFTAASPVMAQDSDDDISDSGNDNSTDNSVNDSGNDNSSTDLQYQSQECQIVFGEINSGDAVAVQSDADGQYAGDGTSLGDDGNATGGDAVGGDTAQEISQDTGIDINVVQQCIQAGGDASGVIGGGDGVDGVDGVDGDNGDNGMVDDNGDGIDDNGNGVDDDGNGVVDDGDDNGAVGDDNGAVADDGAAYGVESAEGSDDASAEYSVLPDTGGASLIALGAGALLVAGGLLARRIVR